MKRVFDFGVATIGLVLLSPVLLIVALLIRVKLGSPVLFTQTRPGYGGRPFRLSKFRTMTNERAPSGARPRTVRPGLDQLGGAEPVDALERTPTRKIQQIGLVEERARHRLERKADLGDERREHARIERHVAR